MDENTTLTIKAYNQTVPEYHEKTISLLSKEEAKIFREYLGDNALILDHGSGTGRDARFFSEAGYKVTGIDLSQKMVDFASTFAPMVEFRVMDIRDLDFPDESFDGVWSVASLLHLPKSNIQKALKEAYRVLKKGGIFYCSVKQGEGEELISDKRYGGEIRKFYSYFQPNELEKQLRKENFEVINIDIDDSTGEYAQHPWINIFSRKN